MHLRIATWNINSARLRTPLILQFIAAAAPDIICLQETKCPNDLFPRAVFAEAGYAHIALNGIKGYHGVAVLSRIGFAKPPQQIDYCARHDGRHLEVYFDIAGHAIALHNFYVPAGGDLPDPKLNDKFAHKLAFIDEMTQTFHTIRNKSSVRSILVGDLNIAPGTHDVWSSKQLHNVVSHTPIERTALAQLQASLKWEDIARRFVPPSEKLYSWWSYRARDWAATDRGRRLDHIWTTPALAPMVDDFTIMRDVRGWERPSDHVPVIATLKF